MIDFFKKIESRNDATPAIIQQYQIGWNHQNKRDKNVLVGVCSRNSEACSINAAAVNVAVNSL